MKKRQRCLLLTGASGGIGIPIARHYLKNGWKVVMQYHSRKNELTKLAKQYPANAYLLRCDFGKPKEITALAKQAKRLLGYLDAVVNCVGIASRYVPAEESDFSDWNACLGVNTAGAVMLGINSVQPLMDAKGTFLQISTNAIKFRGNNSLPYTTSKLAAEFALESFFRRYYSKGVRFNILRLGMIDSGMRNQVEEYSDEQFRHRVGLIPAGRCGTVADVVRCCDFLLEPSCDFVCGANLVLAGGE